VRFAYPGTGRPALDGLDLDVPEGQRSAIVDATGSGKSKLLNNLLNATPAPSAPSWTRCVS
jgi:ABC-type transport system involved in cytochrome bd biosynthesis fused ATPase/permease subunit